MHIILYGIHIYVCIYVRVPGCLHIVNLFSHCVCKQHAAHIYHTRDSGMGALDSVPNLLRLPHTCSDQTGTDASEQNRNVWRKSNTRFSTWLRTPLQIRPEPTRQITSEPKQNSLKDIFSDSSDGSERLRMRRREVCSGGGRGSWVWWSVCSSTAQSERVLLVILKN